MPACGLDGFDPVRVKGTVEEDFWLTGNAGSDEGCFHATGGAVVHGGIGKVHAGEVCGECLELKEGLESSLGDFALVGSVRGQEFGPLDEVIDKGWDVVAVRACAKEEGGFTSGCVLTRHFCEFADDVGFWGAIWDLWGHIAAEFLWNRGKEVLLS